MYIRREKGPVFVVLPDGTKMTRSDLPPPNTKRWVARRKATVVAAVDNGLIEAGLISQPIPFVRNEVGVLIGMEKPVQVATMASTASELVTLAVLAAGGVAY